MAFTISAEITAISVSRFRMAVTIPIVGYPEGKTLVQALLPIVIRFECHWSLVPSYDWVMFFQPWLSHNYIETNNVRYPMPVFAGVSSEHYNQINHVQKGVDYFTIRKL